MRYNFDRVFDDRYSYIIDNQKYIFKATMFNPDGELIVITRGMILELNLTDDIFEPWMVGTLILDNSEYTDINKGYTIRGDGRDVIKLDIIPVTEGVDYKQQGDNFNKKFALSYIFSLEDEQPMEYKGGSATKYSIVDYDMQVLKERKAFFTSSDLVVSDIPVTQLSDADRQVPTGKCIKRLLVDSLDGATSIFTITSAEDGSESTPEFEDGLSEIFYSSPATTNAYEDVMYLLNHHVSASSKNDFSLLKKNNYTNEYTLNSAYTLFSEAYNVGSNTGGPRFQENFTITGSSVDVNSIITPDQKKPSDALEFGDKGEVLDYAFFNTSPELHRDKIKSQIVHSYDSNKKKFNLDVYDGNIERARDAFSDNYVSNQKGKDGAPYPNFIINGMQKANLAYKNTFSGYGENTTIRKSQGINRLLKNAVITNMGIEITVKGQLHRTSGSFFSLDRVGDYLENKFDNKLLGIYFIVDVQHIFINDTEYYNKLIGIKTYHFEDPKYSEEKL